MLEIGIFIVKIIFAVIAAYGVVGLLLMFIFSVIAATTRKDITY